MTEVRFRARFAELAGDHVYYGNVFRYFEVALLAHLAALGLDYPRLAAAELSPITAEAFARFRAPIRPDQQLAVSAGTEAAAPKRALFALKVADPAGRELAAGRLALTFNRDGAPAPLPAELAASAAARRERVGALDGETRLAPLAERAVDLEPAGELTVRFGETDALGLAYFANYFSWFETGRTEFLRALGWPPAGPAAGAGLLPVAAAWCRYLKPVGPGQRLAVRTGARVLDRTRLLFAGSILAGAEVARGFCLNGYRPPGESRPRPLPPELKSALERRR